MKQLLIPILLLSAALTSNAQNSKETYKINNAQGFIIATLTVFNNDIQEVRNPKGVYLGMYTLRRNVTYDSVGATYGKGNLITKLIEQ